MQQPKASKRRRVPDVNVPFRSSLPAGHSTFTVQIPRAFNDREFYFTDLVLIPEFYSDEAAELGLDTDEELDQLISIQLYLVARMTEGFLADDFLPSGDVPTTPELCNQINDHYEAVRPVGLEHLVHFYDWTDTRWNNENQTWEEFMEIMALAYYGEPLDRLKHFNKLPPSARTIEDANNYLFPTKISEELLQGVRFRMWIAPNVKIYYSTDGQLFAFGFSDDQVGRRSKGRGGNRFVLSNKTKQFRSMVAANQPSIDVLVIYKLRIGLACAEPNFVSDPEAIEMTVRQSRKNTTLFAAFKQVLKFLTDISNLQVQLAYDDITKIFTFSFPANDALRIEVDLPTDLSERIGFKLTTRISDVNRMGEKADDAPDTRETEKKARALCYDTGMVVVSDDNTQTNTTAGIAELLVANLFPTDTGSMTLGEHAFCTAPVTLTVPSGWNTGYGGHVPTTFRLHRFLENNQRTNFTWNNGATLVGNLRGIPI